MLHRENEMLVKGRRGSPGLVVSPRLFLCSADAPRMQTWLEVDILPPRVATTSCSGPWASALEVITLDHICLSRDLGPLDRMILPHPRGNRTGPGGNKCPDDKLHESQGLVKMFNIILKHILSAEEEGSCFCFDSSFGSVQKPFRGDVGSCTFLFFNFLTAGKLFYNVLLFPSVTCSVAQSCPTLCSSMDCSPPGSSAHGIFQARILEWVAISFSRESSQPRDQTRISYVSWLAGKFFTTCVTWEVQCKSAIIIYKHIYPLSSLHPTPLRYHRAPGWPPCVIEQLPTIRFTHDSICMPMLLSQFVPPSPSPAVSTGCSFSSRFISTVFLDSIYMR